MTHGSPSGFPTGRITLVFTDLVDSTRMNRALRDIEYADEIREPHYEQVRTLLARHNGHEIKNLGDGFMLAFAVPLDSNIANPPGLLGCDQALIREYCQRT